MNKKENNRESLTTIRHRRTRSNSIQLNGNSKTSMFKENPRSSPHYRRNYVRYRSNASRSRSRDNSKHRRIFSSIDYREKFLLLFIESLALVHFCSLIYCHKIDTSLAVSYALITYVLFNLLTFTCVQYDTQQIEHGRLQLGENPLLFLLWYGGLIGGSLALVMEKHQNLRSRTFSLRLRWIAVINLTWPFLVYIVYMCRKESTSILENTFQRSLF